LLVFVLGTVLMRSAGCCINDVADRDFDRHVKRTADRPVTRGAVSVKEALVLGAVLALAAFALVLTTSAAAIAWSFAALAVALIYPYAKRHVSMPQAVLGVAFSFGIPMAYAAVQNQVPPQAWALLLGNLFWVLAYDTEYAMVDRDDDLRIGMKTSAITLGRFDVPAIAVFYAAYLALWGWVLEAPSRSIGLWLSLALAAALGGVACLADPPARATVLLPGLSHEPLVGADRFFGRGTVRLSPAPEVRHEGPNHCRPNSSPSSRARDCAARMAAMKLAFHTAGLHRRQCCVGGTAFGGDPLAQHFQGFVRCVGQCRGSAERGDGQSACMVGRQSPFARRHRPWPPKSKTHRPDPSPIGP